MGSRKISFEPAARFDGLEGLMVMNVSLCGPHSFETSTFVPTASEEIPPGLGPEPFLSRNWYLSHQVGFLRIESAAANRTPRAQTARKTRAIRRVMGPPGKCLESSTATREHSIAAPAKFLPSPAASGRARASRRAR